MVRLVYQVMFDILILFIKFIYGMVIFLSIRNIEVKWISIILVNNLIYWEVLLIKYYLTKYLVYVYSIFMNPYIFI